MATAFGDEYVALGTDRNAGWSIELSVPSSTPFEKQFAGRAELSNTVAHELGCVDIVIRVDGDSVGPCLDDPRSIRAAPVFNFGVVHHFRY